MKSADICREPVLVYGLCLMSEGKVQKWSRLSNSGWTKVHDQKRSGHPYI